jgi:hypothetical protein
LGWLQKLSSTLSALFHKEKLIVGILSGNVLNQCQPFIFSLNFDAYNFGSLTRLGPDGRT